MLEYLLLMACVLGQLGAEEEVKCTDVGFPVSTTCDPLSANGCCAKGWIRNALGKCVQEKCTTGSGSWAAWMSRPVTMSCYFHWFLLIFGVFIIVLMLFVILINLAFEVRLCLRKHRQNRYVRFSPRNSPSSSVV